MKKLKRLTSKKGVRNTPENLMAISGKANPLIDKAVHGILASHYGKLVDKPIRYIVSAVWGADTDTELTGLQKKIHNRTEPVIKKVIGTFEFSELNRAQEFALEYIINNLIITKILFALEARRNNHQLERLSAVQENEILESMEPVGNA